MISRRPTIHLLAVGVVVSLVLISSMVVIPGAFAVAPGDRSVAAPSHAPSAVPVPKVSAPVAANAPPSPTPKPPVFGSALLSTSGAPWGTQWFELHGVPAGVAPQANPVLLSYNEAASTILNATSGFEGTTWNVRLGVGVALPTAATIPASQFISPSSLVGCGFAWVGTPPASITAPATPNTAPAGTSTFYEFFLNSTGVPGATLLAFVSNGVSTLLYTLTQSASTSCLDLLSFSVLAGGSSLLSHPSLDSTAAVSIANLAGGSTFLQDFPGSEVEWLPTPGSYAFDSSNLTALPPMWTVEYVSPCGPATGSQGGLLYVALDGNTGAVLSNVTSQGTCSLATGYAVTFTETGLPTGTSWTVSLQGAENTSTSTSIGFLESNGSYDYVVELPSGYVPTPGQGTVTVSGSAISVAISFRAAPTYAVTFHEIGLPSGTLWGVMWNASFPYSTSALTLYSNTTTIVVRAVNGTYPFLVVQGAICFGVCFVGYLVTPNNGSEPVSGAPRSVTITFSLEPVYRITASEQGLPAGSLWAVELYNTYYFIVPVVNSTTTSQVTFDAPNGSYELAAAVASPFYYNSSAIALVTIAGGPAAVTFNFTYRGAYVVTFDETGLSPSTAWSVEVGNYLINSTTSSSVTFTLANGTYPFVAGGAPGYLPYPANGTFTVVADTPTITIHFSTSAFVTNYEVIYTETGLTAGTSWSVMLNGALASSTNSTVRFLEPNGTYQYTVPSVPGYIASPSSGGVTVDGAAVHQSITFTALPPGQYVVTFSESGLPVGTSWSVTFNGTPESSSGSSIAVPAPNGSYAFSVGAITGYTASPASGTLTVSGAAVTQAISFASVPPPPTRYSVTFTETGLPSGTNWSVTLNGSLRSTSTNAIVFSEPNGTDSYTVGTVSGYSSNVTSGSVTVAGSAMSISLGFTSTSSGGGSSTSSGGLTTTDWILIGIVIVIVAAVGVAFALRGRRRGGATAPPSQGAPPTPPPPT